MSGAGAAGMMAGGIVGRYMDAADADAAQARLEAILNAVDEQTGEVAPDMRRNQADAIEYLRNMYAQGGMDAQAKAALGQAQQSNAARERMSRGAITTNAATRGVGGSGVEIAAQLANQQGGANRNAMAGTQAAADARTRAINALMGSANIAGNVRGEDSSIAQFNAAQRLRKAGMRAGVEQGNLDYARSGPNRFDYGQMGGMMGAGVDALSSKRDDEEVSI